MSKTYKPQTRIVNKQQSVSTEALPKRSTVKLRSCLGILRDGTYCSNTFESLDAADRLCARCKISARKKYLRKTSKVRNSRRMKSEQD